jgi:hypothetical protein
MLQKQNPDEQEVSTPMDVTLTSMLGIKEAHFRGNVKGMKDP